MTRHNRPLVPLSLAALTLVAAAAVLSRAADEQTPPTPDSALPVEQRIEDLLKRLTLDEKIRLVHADSLFTVAGVPRLGIPGRSLSDGPHGVRQELGERFRPAGRSDDFATWLPVGVALAATWNPELAQAYGETLGREALARGKSILLGPAVNIHRTPLCGRNFEYFGEDPLLAARMAVPWIRGIQAQGVAACVKHFALNNQEWQRGTIDVQADERTLREIYLPAFEAAVKQGEVLTVMGAYNKFRGQHACHNDYLLNQVLKGEWGFEGLVMSDWNGAHDTREAARNGLDLEMGTRAPSHDAYFLANPFKELLEKGELPLSLLDDKVRRNLRVTFATRALEERPRGALNTPAHQQTARKVAEEAIVLLKNDGGLLPLDPARVHAIAVIGENATREQAHGGGSSEVKAFYEVTPLEGILRRAGGEMDVVYSLGYGSAKAHTAAEKAKAAERLERAVAAAQRADVAIVVGGLNHAPGLDAEGADRQGLELPGGQAELIRRVVEANPRTVVVLVSGGPVAMDPWLAATPAVVQAWYGGMEGGNALAAVLFGDVSPSGKLPATFPKALADSPAHALGAYPGRDGVVRYEEGLLVGYRWFDDKKIEPLFPFGHGLSYTSFEYSGLRVRPAAAAPEEQGALAVVEVDLANTGARAGAEVVQLYVSDDRASLPRPPKELKGFRKVLLGPGEKRSLALPLRPEAFAFYDPPKRGWRAEAGDFTILVGSSSRDIRARGAFRLAKTLAPAR